ncbi:MAG: GntR family transcriptional regulator [Chitinivibrionales bacterium]|nr:GntR family transcriptional regulator [Chitinivibrionales bacterium]MBD3394706.1 GntR family transcriptional regulator [Chitinivibrionales bacterium]
MQAQSHTRRRAHKSKTVTPSKPFVPIYEQLVGVYRDDILAHRLAPGSRIDSINDIMVRHGVSRETAKLVLKILARDGLIIQKPGKGSFVADLRPRKKTWGVVLPFYSVQYEYLLEQLADKAWRMGREFHHFVDYNSFEDEIRLVGRLINERYEAVIVVPTQDETQTSDFYSRLSAQGTFVALMDHTMAGSYFPYVIQSYDLGVQRGMRHLAERAGGAIAFVRNEVWADRNVVQEMMEETYKQFIDSERIQSHPIVIDRMNRVNADFLRSESIRGIFCCDDADAVRILGRLREAGMHIPGDLCLVSYGNTELARFFTPTITSIDPHSEEMAETMARIMDSRLHGENTDYCQYVVQPTLEVRET